MDELVVDEEPSQAAFVTGRAELQVYPVFIEYVKGIGSASRASVAG